MALRYVVYDTELIPDGDRIPVLNGSDPIRYESLDEIEDRITALEQVKGRVYFSNVRYFEIPLSTDLNFELWEILQDEQGYEYSNRITHVVKVNKKVKDGVTTLIIESTNPIMSGYIQFY